jgi:carbonic anhydrase/acetyltransferase-like protein (isoleucine patch superfamily)
VKLGAIVAIESEQEVFPQSACWPTTTGSEGEPQFGEPLACIEVAGYSTAERVVDRLLNAEVDFISVLIKAPATRQMPRLEASEKVRVQPVTDLASTIPQILADYSKNGIEHSFVTWSSAYAETDLLDLFYFHREARQTITPTVDREGAVPLWVADCAKAQQSLSDFSPLTWQLGKTSYFIRGYVNRLNHPRNLRQLAADTLRGRCYKRPRGREISPGVWLGEGAEVHRGARIVGPAYIGSGSKVLDNVLITRLSCIERDCRVDCGTVIEDSSVLANTQIGMWLDVCHAVVSGNKTLNLERDVLVEIRDPTVLRFRTSGRDSRSTGNRPVAQQLVADQHKREKALSAWQFVAPSYPRLNEE